MRAFINSDAPGPVLSGMPVVMASSSTPPSPRAAPVTSLLGSARQRLNWRNEFQTLHTIGSNKGLPNVGGKNWFQARSIQLGGIN